MAFKSRSLKKRDIPKVPNWWVMRFHTRKTADGIELPPEWEVACIAALKSWSHSYCVYREKIGEDREHCHAMWYDEGSPETVKKKIDNWFNRLAANREWKFRGNAVRSAKQAENSFLMALGYTSKEKNLVVSTMLLADIENASKAWVEWKESDQKDKTLQTADKALKHIILKRCRDEGCTVRECDRHKIGYIVLDECIKSDKVISDRTKTDYAVYVRDQLLPKGESLEKDMVIEKFMRNVI